MPAPKKQAGKLSQGQKNRRKAQRKRLENSVSVEEDGGFVFNANVFTRKSMGIPDAVVCDAFPNEREARYEEWCRKQESYPVLIDYERARKSKLAQAKAKIRFNKAQRFYQENKPASNVVCILCAHYHNSDDCPIRLCLKCNSPGHEVSACDQKARCVLCNQVVIFSKWKNGRLEG